MNKQVNLVSTNYTICLTIIKKMWSTFLAPCYINDSSITNFFSCFIYVSCLLTFDKNAFFPSWSLLEILQNLTTIKVLPIF